jgi:hypothetical protein
MTQPPIGIFDPNMFSEAQLLQIRDTAVNLLTQGKTVMSWVGEGTSASRQFTMPPDQMLAEVTWSLKSKLPKKYGHIATRARNQFI